MEEKTSWNWPHIQPSCAGSISSHPWNIIWPHSWQGNSRILPVTIYNCFSHRLEFIVICLANCPSQLGYLTSVGSLHSKSQKAWEPWSNIKIPWDQYLATNMFFWLWDEPDNKYMKNVCVAGWRRFPKLLLIRGNQAMSGKPCPPDVENQVCTRVSQYRFNVC